MNWCYEFQSNKLRCEYIMWPSCITLICEYNRGVFTRQIHHFYYPIIKMAIIIDEHDAYIN